ELLPRKVSRGRCVIWHGVLAFPRRLVQAEERGLVCAARFVAVEFGHYPSVGHSPHDRSRAGIVRVTGTACPFLPVDGQIGPPVRGRGTRPGDHHPLGETVEPRYPTGRASIEPARQGQAGESDSEDRVGRPSEPPPPGVRLAEERPEAGYRHEQAERREEDPVVGERTAGQAAELTQPLPFAQLERGLAFTHAGTPLGDR